MPEQIFSIANTAALLAWVLLAVFPSRRWAHLLIPARLVPALLGTAYAVILGLHWGEGGGGFGTLAEVARLFANKWALLAGWLHYLTFDLFTGSWEVRDSRARGIPHYLVVPCLLLTFLFGPAGLLLYLLVRRIAGGPDRESV